MLKSRQIAQVLVGVFIVAGLSGCFNAAKLGSDLVGTRNETAAEAAIKASLAAEMSPASNVEDGRKWFARHGIPLDYDLKREDGTVDLLGGFSPFSVAGWWGSTSLGIHLHFGTDGHYVESRVEWGASCL